MVYFFYYCALERSETHTWIEPCKVRLWQQPHNGLFFIIVRLSVAKRTLRSNLVRFGCGNNRTMVYFYYYCALERSETHTWIEPCKVRLRQQPHYDHIIIEELLYLR
jgi:hypothetical protein